MIVKLVGYTQTMPGSFIGINYLQDFVAYCARVSNPTNQMNNETAEKLIKYLIKYLLRIDYVSVSIKYI